MTRIVLALISIGFAFGLHAQTPALDSLNRLLKTAASDSMQGYILDELSYEWFYESLDSSLYYGYRGLEVFQSIKNKVGQARSLTSIAVAFHYKNNWDSAEYYYREALELKQEINDSVGQAGSLNNLGVLSMDKGDLEKAATYFLTSLKLKEDLQDSVGIVSGNANLGLIFRKQGNYTSAIEYYTRALEYGERLNLIKKLPTIYLNIGSLYNFQGKFEKGLQYNRKGLAVSQKLNAKRYLGESYVNMGDSFVGLEMTDSSLIYTKKAIEIFRNNADTVNLARALNSAATLYLYKKEYRIALLHSKEVKALNQDKNLDLKVKNAFNLSQAYDGLGQMRKAHDALTVAYASKDSLLNESLNESIAGLTAKFESEKKERKIIELELNRKDSDLALASSENQRNMFVLITALILAFSIFLFVLLRIKSRSGAALSKSLSEKETLLKEIHHRVKNNLQVVSSLLSMQSRFIKDEGALDAVNEGQARVESMALIHQKLYQENNLSGVSAKEYVEDLAEVLRNSYGMEDKVDIAYDIDNLVIDVDTIIPIGLILNELISNSFKHAFPNGKEGDLVVGLKEIDQELILTVKDDGVGSSGESTEESFGMVLIDSLAMKLKATLEMNYESGALTKLSIKKYKLV